MRRLSIAAAAVGAAAVLTVAVPASAHAATGKFQYTHAYTKLTVAVKDPPDAVCIPTTANGSVANNTDRSVTLFPSPACAGEPLGTLPPQGAASDLSFASVMFTAP